MTLFIGCKFAKENAILCIFINRKVIFLPFQSCNRYLKWVGVERCCKPISGGPTLAGLPGGVAGDLLRLYPVKSNDEYPIVGIRTPNLDDPVLVCRPLPKKVSYT